MSVEMNNRISMKPGFGKKFEIPKGLASSRSNAASSVFNDTASLSRTSLKSSVSQSISTSSLNRSFSTGYSQSGSSVFGQRSATFVPGTHLMGVSDFSHNRNDIATGVNTSGIGFDSSVKGYRSGKHDMELMTGGWTKRSERRALQRMGMVDLNAMQGSSGGGKKMSLLGKIAIGLGIGAVGVGLGVGIAKLIKNNKADKANNENESNMAKLNKLSQQQSKGDGKVKAKDTKADTVDVSRMSMTQLESESAKLDQNFDNLINDFDTNVNTNATLNTQISEQQSKLDATNGQINDTGNKITQSKNNESSSLLALNAAKSQVSMLEGQLSNPNLSDIQKQAIESSLKQAKDAVAQKQEQYDNAVKNTQNLESQLAELNTQAEGIQASIDGLKDDVKSLEKEREQIGADMLENHNQTAAVETALLDKRLEETEKLQGENVPKEEQA